MQLAHKRFHLGVFGGSGTGKTEYALRFAAHAGAQCVFLFDAEGEFCERMKIPPARTTFELERDVETGFVCYDPHIMFPGEMEAAVSFFGAYALKAAEHIPGRKLFVVDEFGQHVTGHSVPKPIKTIVQTGRRYGLDGVFIAHQPNELHNTVRCQLSEVVCFQLTDEEALKFPKAFGFDVEAIRALGPHQFICRNNRGGEFRSKASPSRNAAGGVASS